MRRLKSFGERIASRDPDRQAAEIHTRIALMNRFSALAGLRSLALPELDGKGRTRPQLESRNNAGSIRKV